MSEHPSCPICHHAETKLIATVKEERTVEIYLCQHCWSHFTYERASGRVKTDVLPA
jgi:transposase-like protein